MVEPVSISSYRDDTLWAVVASIGRTSRVAEVFSSRLAAVADQAWREQQVNAYAHFLRKPPTNASLHRKTNSPGRPAALLATVARAWFSQGKLL